MVSEPLGDGLLEWGGGAKTGVLRAHIKALQSLAFIDLLALLKGPLPHRNLPRNPPHNVGRCARAEPN
jgi:hypothetical protein